MGRVNVPSLTLPRLRLLLCFATVAIIFIPSIFLLSLAHTGELWFLSPSVLSFCPSAPPQQCPQPVSCPAHHPPPAQAPPTCHSEKQTLFPKVFKQIPSLYVNSSEPLQDPVDWEELLLPPNGGFLMVENKHDPTLEPQGYGVSMFHQLHCVTMIRKMLLNQPMSAAMEAGGEAWVKDPGHWTHCLDYLVESILCAGDNTVEVPKPKTMKDGSVVEGVDGMGHVHMCRNVRGLWDIVTKSAEHPIKASEVVDGRIG